MFLAIGTQFLVISIIVVILLIIILFVSRYKKCPSDKVMVIYGKVGSTKDCFNLCSFVRLPFLRSPNL